ncbi:MFS transporter [Rheinheimera sp.]|uniref:MFS transporter n=1 Tax=Rheinheimera sp. TaxID=1869214 RepID=UPI0027B8E7C7|nr:MFS transporter [Rheinheimera sp.]
MNTTSSGTQPRSSAQLTATAQNDQTAALTSDAQTNKKTKRSPFPVAFYVANSMEIFERLAWYGFFSLSSLYLTSPLSQGGLGFSEQQRGFVQGMIPFLLYLLPVLTGAMADRYGYRRMFLLSFMLMAPGYYLLGQVSGFWSFFAVFVLVALGAACFKPVVVGTVGRCTDDSNRGLGFGIFYTMVNIGGFIGPLVAGYVRAISWDWVFIMSAFWISLNFIPALFWYKEPSLTTAEKANKTNALPLLQEVRLVLGNGRLALLVLPLLLLLMCSPLTTMTFWQALAICAFWITLNLCWSLLLGAANIKPSRWYLQQLQTGNKAFVCYLLILTGFWTIYNQLFITVPLFIRDFVDTSDLVQSVATFAPSWLDYLAVVNLPQLQLLLPELAAGFSEGSQSLQQVSQQLYHHKLRVPLAELQLGLQALAAEQTTAATLASQWQSQFRQINPEYIVNLGFAAIVLMQIVISALIQRLPALPILVGGTLVLSAGLFCFGLSGLLVVGGFAMAGAVLLFSLGEMLASPKSQEYVAAIAPGHQTAMYMGYYFVAMALGYLFAGLLSGWAYQLFAIEQQQPMLMWTLFAALGLATALLLMGLHLQLPRHPKR